MPNIVTAFILISSIFRTRHIVKTQSENNFVIRESIIIIHTVLFISAIAFEFVFMAVENGSDKRYSSTDNVSNYRHEVVFYVFDLAS